MGEGFLTMEVSCRMEAADPGWMGQAQRPNVAGFIHTSTTDQKEAALQGHQTVDLCQL